MHVTGNEPVNLLGVRRRVAGRRPYVTRCLTGFAGYFTPAVGAVNLGDDESSVLSPPQSIGNLLLRMTTATYHASPHVEIEPRQPASSV